MSAYTYSADYEESAHHDDRFDFPAKAGVHVPDWEFVAKLCAEDYFDNHDGWESGWPLQFRIYEDGVEVARCSVEQEAQPHFYATELELPPPSPSVAHDAKSGRTEE